MKRLSWSKLVRRLPFVVLALGTLIALFYAEENWRGARAWADCERQLWARGESLDPAALIPSPVPDEQNFLASPAWNAWTGPVTAVPTPLRFMVKFHFPSNDLNWSNGHSTDLAGWQDYFSDDLPSSSSATVQSPARAMLAALEKFTPTLEEIERAAAKRPLSRLPMRYEMPMPVSMPYVASFANVVRILSLRACAELAEGSRDRARRDIMLAGRVGESVKEEPILLLQLVRANCAWVTLQPLWEGMAARIWSKEDLAGFRQQLQSIDFLDGHARAFRGERVLWLNRALDSLRDNPSRWQALDVLQRSSETRASGVLRKILAWLAPTGWFNQNKAAANLYRQKYFIDPIDVKSHRILVEQAHEGGRSAKFIPYRLIPPEEMPVFALQVIRLVRVQGAIDQGAAACALEEYALDHGGAYPAILDALLPDYLNRIPTNLIDGAPIRYERTDDGRYRLTSPKAKYDVTAPATDVVWQYKPQPKP